MYICVCVYIYIYIYIRILTDAERRSPGACILIDYHLSVITVSCFVSCLLHRLYNIYIYIHTYMIYVMIYIIISVIEYHIITLFVSCLLANH